ncbi:beta-glucanase (GH16 family) [Parabacteroides sp. PF5-5]|uniref:glycoside hydrolase family 16 protein n=1 Tax=unclassified Parabacteroides TaxID=2649774 RepID=UPI002476718E|nr:MULTISPECIES: glycoside hydrolase family 16 protein [unclassified Parabacteroides]MDH6306291.1 beta-glucanase (GH16 family) [Parabacteroides sp. PH5-39]MDH6316918.1 beta-glucanase (GH16 family) [Parabacteroides sp. PF5-13]MDH6320987.1 beta-glucanase (GH16 family) [Parabacteroides sp. PH5-13]MDH6324719.1 beta-glucanase (GH16 family) [Parabacteroides sp. PH5-8]MDH6328103.1 beta-glucanase (GH16 family) [Parabacteroides sp. PH5-41]
MTKLFSVLLVAFLAAGYAQGQSESTKKEKYHGRFREDFDKPTSKFFNFNVRESGEDYRYFSGISSLSEKGTKVMLYRIDPEDPAGAGRGPEIVSKDFTHFGSYSARIRIPDITKVQPDAGVVVGYFTYHMDKVAGLSEIDIEWLIADPEIIYIGTWTGESGNLQRVGRIINLAKGIIYDTSYRKGNEASKPLSGIQNMPESIQPIENYNAASQFYTYGFDWYPDRLEWWMLHPTTGNKIVLWNYSGSTPEFTGIPQNPSHYRLNFWHTNNWPVETRPNSIEKPLYPYELEVDWMLYTPFKGITKNR